ncbi:MAG: hypothetical protein DRP85_04160 [Candidatus Makaraimicrobium thalassicum]|nr:MAG: hypothetical protein DRP85_04160 [Candidatus Omnitrophota bacterium]
MASIAGEVWSEAQFTSIPAVSATMTADASDEVYVEDHGYIWRAVFRGFMIPSGSLNQWRDYFVREGVWTGATPTGGDGASATFSLPSGAPTSDKFVFKRLTVTPVDRSGIFVNATLVFQALKKP